MRKLMRDRFQRRKKKPAEATDQPAPPPLQPAYFDAEQLPAATASKRESSNESEPPAMPKGELEPESRSRSRGRSARSAPTSSTDAPFRDSGSPANDAPSSDAASADNSVQPLGASEPSASEPSAKSAAAGEVQRTRGRRRRGGRGRNAGRGREQAVAQAFTPKGITPSVSVETPVDAEEPAEVGEPETAIDSAAQQTPKVPATATVTQRAPKGIVVLAIGLPGSGKSSWFKRHSVVPLSSDMVRSLLFDDVREQRFQDLVFSNLRSMLKARLIAKRPMNYVDATNLTPQERQHWIKLAKDYGYEVHAVFFDVPLDVCIERHQRRDRVVPEDVMRRMAAKLRAPTFEEGFAKITVVRVKKKDDSTVSD
jgi:predicted kinase